MTTISFCTACGAATQAVTPPGDTRTRDVCTRCETIHYQNPKIVVGAIPVFDGKILLCKRAIEPRYGYWTLPAGFMELAETMAEGAARETWEEACAKVDIGRLYAVVDVVQAGQVHVFFTATFDGTYAVGEESLEVALYAPEDIPWPEIAFPSGRYALECYIKNGEDTDQTFLHTAERFRP